MCISFCHITPDTPFRACSGSKFNAGLDRLSSAIEAGEALQSRMRESLQMRSPLEDLQALADQAAQLPVYVSDVDTVQALLGKAQDWLRKANTLAAQVRLFGVGAPQRPWYVNCDTC